MSLFEVPGWSVPAAPVAQQSKKRKRPPPKEKEVDDMDEAQRIKAAQKNIEKLMQSLGTSSAALDADVDETPAKKKRTGKEKKGKAAAAEPERGRGPGRDGKKGREQRAASKEKQPEKAPIAASESSQSELTPGQKKQKEKHKEKKKKQKTKQADSTDVHSDAGPSQQAPTHPVSPKSRNVEQPTPKKSTDKPSKAEKPQGLTALQANMRKSLDGARFRLINETLYKSDSAKAHELMRSDPAVFADYHTGFRHQVESWPTNPVSHYISTLSSYPPKTVIADLGCGDAALARALVPKGMTVLSFDLVSDGAYVIEADTCDRIPLPGSERPLDVDDTDEGDEEVGEGQVVDVVVCALSLMGTNWPGCIREAWRILKADGELKIAEVASRFSDVDEFTSFICSFGFTLKSKDERNTHFTLFEFKKVSRNPKGEKEWKKLAARGSILKPCEYKRR